MILTTQLPFTSEEIEFLKEEFGEYIKTVIDIEKRICSAGCNRHFESEKKLLSQGSSQSNLWGGGVDLETLTIDFNSFINIRPTDDNSGNEIQDSEIRQKFEHLTKYFFQVLYAKK